MSKNHFKKIDIFIIVSLFVLYMLGYHFLVSSEPDKQRKRAVDHSLPAVTKKKNQDNSERTTKHYVKILNNDWPLDLGKYYYTIDIEPGYEMEDEEFEVVGESGDKLLVKRHNDWPDISGHFEWYCNEKLTSTQQMFDYVVAHHGAILRQMQEVQNRGINSVADEASYFQDHYDEYIDDPEDEIRFPPEIFDANED